MINTTANKYTHQHPKPETWDQKLESRNPTPETRARIRHDRPVIRKGYPHSLKTASCNSGSLIPWGAPTALKSLPANRFLNQLAQYTTARHSTAQHGTARHNA